MSSAAPFLFRSSRLGRLLHGVAVVASTIVACLLATRVNAAAKPNVVFIVADDAGYADFGFTSARLGLTTQFQTPNLDALASRSVELTDLYMTSSACSTSRAGMLTGRYQQRFGFHFILDANDKPNEGIVQSENLLFEQMKSMGYKTSTIGKWHLGENAQFQPNVHGVDYFFGFKEGQSAYLQNPNDPSAYNLIRRNGTPVQWWNEPSFNNNAPDSNPPVPGQGRYLTDAFADEASKYIADNASGPDPFLMYVSLNAPHTPWQPKTQDLAVFANTTLTTDQKKVAALEFGMDRAIGQIVNRLSDPNGDGNLADSIADNTIIVFTNDNGAPDFGGVQSNGYLKGFKGSGYEGGTRVPGLVYIPGMAPGLYDKPVSGVDFFPTFVAAAGGPLPTNLDGVDLAPYLSGANSSNPHQYLYQYTQSLFASIQDDQWKLVRPNASSNWQLFQLNANGSGENVDLSAQNPTRVADMARQFVHWLAGVDKPLNTSDAKANRTNYFTFNPVPGSTLQQWSANFGWIRGDTNTACIPRALDGTSRATFEVSAVSTGNYTINNTFRLGTGASTAAGDPASMNVFMLNQLKLTGSFTAQQQRAFHFNGTPFLFAASPEGDLATINATATSDATTSPYDWKFNTPIVMLDDLHVIGNSPHTVHMFGAVSDFDQPRSIFKTGAVTVKMYAANTYQGDTIVGAGTLELAAPAAQIKNNRYIVVQNGAQFKQTTGAVDVAGVSVDPGSSYVFTNGTLHADEFIGNLSSAAGTVLLGGVYGNMNIMGNYAQSGSGKLSFDLSAAEIATEAALLAANAMTFTGGQLNVLLHAGYIPHAYDQFHLLSSPSISATTLAINLPSLPAGLLWNSSALLTTGWLGIAPAGGASGAPGDFNLDQAVDPSDLALWKQRYGTGSDLLGPLLGGGDFLSWQRGFGGGSSQPALGAVPEPGSIGLVVAGLLTLAAIRKRR